MNWTVETLNATVDAELAALPAGLRARLLRLMELIEDYGIVRLREPNAKHVEGKLWELRVKGGEGIARALYVTASGRRLVILHAFVKKSGKTPKRALDTARQRLKEVAP